jgi:hypothetical protein
MKKPIRVPYTAATDEINIARNKSAAEGYKHG